MSNPKSKATRNKRIKSITPSTRVDTQAVALLQYLLAYSNAFYPRLKADDKTINIDGYIDALNNLGQPVGVLEVQVKSLPNGQMKKSCPTSLVHYAENNALPVLFICMDRNARVGYWTQVSKELQGYNEDQATFTITFDESNIIDSSLAFTDAWINLAQSRAQLPAQYETLNSSLASHLPETTITHLQRFIATFNAELSTNWRVIKNLLFPKVWQFGIMVNHFDDNARSLVFQLYCILEGSPTPVITAGRIMDPDENDLLWNRKPFLLRFTSDFHPEKEALSIIQDFLNEIIENDVLESPSKAILEETCYAAHNTFPILADAVKDGKVQVKQLLASLKALNISEISIPSRGKKKAAELQAKSIQACLRLDADFEIPYRGKTYPLFTEPGQDNSNAVANLKNILSNLISEYQTFLKAFGLSFLANDWLRQDQQIIFVIKPKCDSIVLYDTYFATQQLHLPRIQIFNESIDKVLFNYREPILVVNGSRYNLHSASIKLNNTINHGWQPLNAILKDMLIEDVKSFFKRKQNA